MDPNQEGEHKDKQPNTMDPYREGGRFDLPATTMRISATRQQEIAEKAERKRASASERMEDRDGDGEHITRNDGGKGRAVTLGFPRAPPHLPPARAEPKFLAAIAHRLAPKKRSPRAFLQMQAVGEKCTRGARPWTRCRQPNVQVLHPVGLVGPNAANQTRP